MTFNKNITFLSAFSAVVLQDSTFLVEEPMINMSLPFAKDSDRFCVDSFENCGFELNHFLMNLEI